MPSSWIVTRATRDGGRRHVVRYRLGGRESAQRYAGSFRTRAEAIERRRWVDGELAAMRVPDLSVFDHRPVRAPTLADAVAVYRASRIDIAEATRTNIGTSLNLIVGVLDASRQVDAFSPQEIADAVARLHASSYKRETIRKAITHLACVFDFAGVAPNPVRDKLRVRLPRGEVREPVPPSAEHVEGVYRLLPSKHRLALLWLDWSGARVSSIVTVVVGDYDEPRRRVRLRAAASKTGRALWVDLPDGLAEAIERTLPPRGTATRKPACSPRVERTRSGRASLRRVAPGACHSGPRTTFAIAGSASSTDRGERGLRSGRSWGNARSR